MRLSPNSIPSYWLYEAPFQSPSTEPLPDSADIVVIGAGLTGMSTAYWLQQMEPSLKVVVLDARGIASGATGRNGGIISPGLNDDYEETVAAYGEASAKRLVEFDYRNVDALTEFLSKHADKDKGPFDPEFTWTKGTVVAWSSEQEAEEARPGAEKLAKQIPDDIRVLSPEESRRMTGVEAFRYGGLHVKTTAIAWAAKIVFCLARCVQNKVHIATHTPVQSVESKQDHINVHTTRGVIRASKVAYCTNAWTQRLLGALSGCIVPVRNQVVSVCASPSTPRFDYIISADRGYQYLSCRPNGDIIMGGMRNIVPSKQEHEDDDSTLNMAVSHALRTFMRETIKAPNIDREWVGVMGFSKDRLPLMGDLRHVLGTDQGRGQYIAAGFTGHGMPRTFLCGRALAQLLTGQQPEDWFPTEFLLEHPSRSTWWNSNKL